MCKISSVVFIKLGKLKTIFSKIRTNCEHFASYDHKKSILLILIIFSTIIFRVEKQDFVPFSNVYWLLTLAYDVFSEDM